MYWLKVGVSIIAAVLCVILQVYVKLDGSMVFLLGSAFYIVSSDSLSNYLKLEKGHGIKIGIGAYIFTWIMVWTILYTYLRV